MRATFDGTVLAPGGYDRTDAWVSSFRLAGTPQIQTVAKFRADYATLHARGGTVHTIDVLLIPPPEADLETAFAELALFWAGLSDQGDLVITSGSQAVTWPEACKAPFTFEPNTGVQNRFPLQFLAGAPSALTTLSTLAQMDARYVANLHTITGLTGGTATDLDGYATTDVAAGFTALILPTIGGIVQPKTFRLIAATTAENTDPTAGLLVVRPDDYHATTNAKVWVEVG
jgi:hypothetical protein